MPEKRARGFAAMNPEQQRQIASMGGRAAHQRGTAHQWDSREAAEAGRKGGKAAHGAGRTNGTHRTNTDAPSTNGHPAAMETTSTQWSENTYENRGTPAASEPSSGV